MKLTIVNQGDLLPVAGEPLKRCLELIETSSCQGRIPRKVADGVNQHCKLAQGLEAQF